MNEEFQMIKEELARLGTRMDNVEGYFDNFTTTLDNHMNDYKAEQKKIGSEVGNLKGDVRQIRGNLSWGFWVIFGLLILVMGGFITGFVILLANYLG